MRITGVPGLFDYESLHHKTMGEVEDEISDPIGGTFQGQVCHKLVSSQFVTQLVSMGEPIGDEVMPGLQRDRSQTDKVYLAGLSNVPYMNKSAHARNVSPWLHVFPVNVLLIRNTSLNPI